MSKKDKERKLEEIGSPQEHEFTGPGINQTETVTDFKSEQFPDSIVPVTKPETKKRRALILKGHVVGLAMPGGAATYRTFYKGDFIEDPDLVEILVKNGSPIELI